MNQSDTDHAIVMTGCGWVTPFARGTIEDVLTAAAKTPPAPPAGPGYWPVPDAVRDEHPKLANELKRDKSGWMTAIAFEWARRSAALEGHDLAPERVGLALGIALAGQLGMIDFATEVRAQGPRFVSPIHFPQTVGNYVAGALARAYDIRGASVTLASGTASGLDALVEACGQLTSGSVDVVYAGGTELLSEALADGLPEGGPTPSEGACLFVLERSADATARRAANLATVIRYGFGGAPAESPPARGLRSIAGFRQAGGVFIEHWTGRCIGVAGSAAAAAGIGAAGGHPVPIVDTPDPPTVRIGQPTDEFDVDTAGYTPVTVQAMADTGRLTTLELAIQRS